MDNVRFHRLEGFEQCQRVTIFADADTGEISRRQTRGAMDDPAFIDRFAGRDAARIGMAVARIAHDGISDRRLAELTDSKQALSQIRGILDQT